MNEQQAKTRREARLGKQNRNNGKGEQDMPQGRHAVEPPEKTLPETTAEAKAMALADLRTMFTDAELYEPLGQAGATDADWKAVARIVTSISFLPINEVLADGGRCALHPGFLPGTTILFYTRKPKPGQEQTFVFETTHRVQGELPQGETKLSATPRWFKKALTIRLMVSEALGGDPTPFTKPGSRDLTDGKGLREPLRMFFYLRKSEGDKQVHVPFGVTLVYDAQNGEVVVDKLFDPTGKSGVRLGQRIPASDFRQQFPSPISVLLRTWKNMGRACFQALNPPRQNGN